VTFDIDANGIVNVVAKDKATGKEQQIRIQASGGLSEQEIERMVRDAEANAEADRRRRELVEARNQADATIYATERAVSEAGEGLPADARRQAEEAVADLREAMSGEDLGRIRQASERLTQLSGSLAEARRQAQQPGAGEQPSDERRPGVVDAEFEETDKPDDRKSG
jgi:molecular chaperone DnaK